MVQKNSTVLLDVSVFHQNKFIVSDFGNNCLKIFDHSGKFLRKIGEQGEGDGQLNNPWGLCVEKSGNHHNILVCDSGNVRIVQFSVEGSFAGKTVTKFIREGTFFLGGEGLGNFGIFSPKKCWPSLAF